MRVFVLVAFIVGLGFSACNSDAKTDKEIDALNQAIADSLLNDALSDTVKMRTDSISRDSI